jgi:hypothetical protein
MPRQTITDELKALTLGDIIRRLFVNLWKEGAMARPMNKALRGEIRAGLAGRKNRRRRHATRAPRRGRH